ncbi:hypothetical protein P7C73_g2310, partial [Tremellales sp. Uapishka_1]
MAFSYSNPYVQPTTRVASIPSSILLSGLPPDVTDVQVKELLSNPPLNIRTLVVQSLFSSSGESLGIALVQLSSAQDAEKVRDYITGQTIDDTYQMMVSHVLDPHATHPSLLPTPVPVLVQPVSQRMKPAPPTQPKAHVQPKAAAPLPTLPKGKSPNANASNGKPPGLQLLSRLSKPSGPGNSKAMTPKERQLAIMAAQKAHGPGSSLLSRLAKSSPQAKTKTKPKHKGSTGDDKVARAKKSSSTAMEVDKKVVEPKKKVKTQAELDEEMRAYERARRFAA